MRHETDCTTGSRSVLGVSGGNMVAEKEIDLTYNADGTFSSITRMLGSSTVVTATYTYDDLERLTGLVYSQGSTTLSSYALTYSDSTTASSFASTTPSGGMWVPGQNIVSPVPDTADIPYALENSANLAAGLVSTVNSSDGQVQYSCDAQGQLIGATYTGGGLSQFSSDENGTVPLPSEAYSYDANGNRTGGGYVVGPNNEILSDGTYNYAYDPEGNLTERTNIATGAMTDYTWDARDRLTEVTDYASAGGPATQVVQYYYDADNRWIGETINQENGQPLQETAFAYTGNQIVLQFDGTSATGSASALTVNDLSHRYLWGPAVDQILADEQLSPSISGGGQGSGYNLSAPGTVVFPLADQLGTVRDLAVYNSQTATTVVVNHMVYGSYGNLLSQTNPVTGGSPVIVCLFKFTGRATDAATGLQNNLNRWYDAVLGGWLSQDPSGIAGGGDPNLGRYCGNSPTSSTDPMGLYSITVDVAGAIDAYKDILAAAKATNPNAIALSTVANDYVQQSVDHLIAKGWSKATAFPLVVAGRQPINGLPDISGAATYAVLEFAGHANSMNTPQNIIYGDQATQLNPSNVAAFIATLKAYFKFTSPSLIILDSCLLGCYTKEDDLGTGTSVVQQVANALGCEVISAGGYMLGSIINGGVRVSATHDYPVPRGGLKNETLYQYIESTSASTDAADRAEAKCYNSQAVFYITYPDTP
jgi:RHS repeat-associated protein